MSGVKAGIMVSNQQFEGVDMVKALDEQIVMIGWPATVAGIPTSPGSII